MDLHGNINWLIHYWKLIYWIKNSSHYVEIYFHPTIWTKNERKTNVSPVTKGVSGEGRDRRNGKETGSGFLVKLSRILRFFRKRRGFRNKRFEVRTVLWLKSKK